MSTIHLINREVCDDVRAEGLAPVVCYDPYYSRMLHYLREVLADGHPVLIRLHSASEYPAADEVLYKVDLEGHAVLVVGYDDDREAVAVADPWNLAWGGKHSGVRWIGYNELSMIIVDSTLDLTMIVAPLSVDVTEAEVETDPALDVCVGFYAPAAIVMDRDNQDIRKINLALFNGERVVHVEQSGCWRVGEKARLTVPLPKGTGSVVTLTVSAEIGGDRPYPYRDSVSVKLTKHLKTGAVPKQELVA